MSWSIAQQYAALAEDRRKWAGLWEDPAEQVRCVEEAEHFDHVSRLAETDPDEARGVHNEWRRARG